MSFTRVNSGGWTANVSQVTAAQLNALDVNMTRAIDGNAGGGYTPSAKIQIGGTAGLEINGTGAAAKLQLSSRSITRVLDNATPVYIEADWVSGLYGIFRTASSTSNSSLKIPCHVPHGATITAIGCYFNPDTHTVAPETYTQISLWQVSTATGNVTQIGSTFTDNGLALAAYDAPHWASLTGLSQVVDRTQERYFISFQPEIGPTNAKVLNWLAARVVYTCTSYDED